MNAYQHTHLQELYFLDIEYASTQTVLSKDDK